jgi:8-oxo-dGTP pyrophosphatase MutT (NUDIX family)
LPGGGIERHETAAMTLIKELREEGNLVATSKPELFHIYLNRAVSKRDHVLLYRLDVRQTEIRKPDYEIRESGFFDPDNLPAEATVATRRRLRELRGEVPAADLW